MLWIAGVCAVCLGVCLPLFMYYKKSLVLHLASSYKALGTLCAFSLALIAAIRLDPRCFVCSAAILVYAVADILIEYHLMLGMSFFMAGHICAISFFLSLSPVSMFHLLCLLLLGGLMGFIFYRWRKSLGKNIKAFLFYGISLVMMSVCALSCFTSNGTAGILISCGGALFCLSDFMLLRRLLFPTSRIFSWLIMITYYSSVLLFGIACLQL